MKVITIQDWYNEYARTCKFLANWLVEKLKIKSNSIIIDLGCGAGAFTIPLATKAKKSKIIAVDKDEKALNELRSNIKRFKVSNIVVMKSDATKLHEIKNSSIDFIFSHWLLGVVTKYSELKQIIKENYRILKKGGIVAHSESYPIPKSKAQELYMKTDILAYRTRWWNPNKIKKIMREIGFRKIRIQLINFKIKIDPKISIPLIREWQKLEYSFTGKKQAIINPKLDSFLKIHEDEIKNMGLNFQRNILLLQLNNFVG
jgi:ubiquinone/menaquinone biosynthesis C-methylase UbiE